MTISNWPRCFKATLAHEGGYVNHPKDPGGATNKGVTQAVYNAWRRDNNKPVQSVRHIAESEVAAIYKDRYWSEIRGDHLPDGLDYVAYDAGVNSGPRNGAKWLQRALGVAADGAIGIVTLRAALGAPDKPATVRKACSIRMGFLRALRHWSSFSRGWTRRVVSVEALAVRMAIEEAAQAPQPAPPVDAAVPTPKPVEEAVREDAATAAKEASKAVKTNTTTASGGAGAGGASGTQVDPAQLADPATWLLVALVVAGLVVAAIFLWRAYVAWERRRLYAEIAKP